MMNYGIGGQEVPKETSEGIADIPQNKTLFIQKLTNDAAVKPDIVHGLKTTEEVFAHYKPTVEVEFEKEDGSTVNENLGFTNLGDFGPKGITQQSPYLQKLNIQKEQYMKMAKQLKTNKLLKSITENKEAKQAYIEALQALVQELDDAK